MTTEPQMAIFSWVVGPELWGNLCVITSSLALILPYSSSTTSKAASRQHFISLLQHFLTWNFSHIVWSFTQCKNCCCWKPRNLVLISVFANLLIWEMVGLLCCFLRSHCVVKVGAIFCHPILAPCSHGNHCRAETWMCILGDDHTHCCKWNLAWHSIMSVKKPQFYNITGSLVWKEH